MAKTIKGNFADNGVSETVLASKFTALVGSDVANDFGGGTATIEVSHDGVEFTTLGSLTEEGSFNSETLAGGLLVKLTLSGATSPDLNYSIKYE